MDMKNYIKELQKKIMQNKNQFGNSSWGGTRKLPYAFTEHGIIILSSVFATEARKNNPAKIQKNRVKKDIRNCNISKTVF